MTALKAWTVYVLVLVAIVAAVVAIWILSQPTPQEAYEAGRDLGYTFTRGCMIGAAYLALCWLYRKSLKGKRNEPER